MKKVREGYKKTLAGEIPEDWWYEELNKLVDKITDGTHKTPTYTESGIPFLRVTDIQKSEIDWSNVKYISQQEHLELIKRCNPEIGDILYSKNGTIGIPKIIDWDNEFSIFVSLCLIKMKKQNSYISNKYLEQFLKSDSCMRQIRLRAKQGTVTNLHLEEIRELIIPIPTIKEQEKIASILSTVDEQIDNVDAMIEKNKELKKGLMQKLLSQGIGHTAFKKTEIGEIPEEWKVSKLGQLFYINTKSVEPSKLEEDILHYSLPAFDESRVPVKQSSIEIKSNKYLIEENSILVSKLNPRIKRIWLVNKVNFIKQICSTEFINYVAINKENVNLKYFEQYFNSDIFQQELLNRESGSTGSRKRVTPNSTMDIKIALPSSCEQEKIAIILSELDEKIEGYENKKQKLEELKKGLMQQLLTGNIRVI